MKPASLERSDGISMAFFIKFWIGRFEIGMSNSCKSIASHISILPISSSKLLACMSRMVMPRFRTFFNWNRAGTLSKGMRGLPHRPPTASTGHLYMPFPTERNGMQLTKRNRTKGKFSFRWVGSYHRSFSAKLQLSFSTESGFLG
uniref:Uncharacterized protein n=1 Tax=Romanomermis culicivorax TaxID=13658 RepID=A0A915JM51_ROMCU